MPVTELQSVALYQRYEFLKMPKNTAVGITHMHAMILDFPYQSCHKSSKGHGNLDLIF